VQVERKQPGRGKSERQKLQHNLPIYVAIRFKLRYCLWLSGANIEDSSGIPKYLKNQRILLANLTNAADKATINIKAFHTYMLFNTNRYTMKRTDRLLVFRKIFIKENCPSDRTLGQEFSNTIRLRIYLVAVTYKPKDSRAHEFLCQSGAP
jgi:hypothetical protein